MVLHSSDESGSTEPSLFVRPPSLPGLGNLHLVLGTTPIQSFIRLMDEYGPVFKFRKLGEDMIFVGSQEIVNELCDERRFEKDLSSILRTLQAVVGDGLFTADTNDPNWVKAHRILIPAFGPLAIRGMYPAMVDIAEQMFLKWERLGPREHIDVADMMTRLTLDTIGLCGFTTRFNSFYAKEMHPFVTAMIGALSESGYRNRRPKLVTNLMRSTSAQYNEDIATCNRVAKELIEQRMQDITTGESPSHSDILTRMLQAEDPVSGEKLDTDNIVNQMVTFLIAGHETTSGLLTFATYLLLANPRVMQEARRVVDELLGDRMPTVEELGKLPYIDQVLSETLRLWPTAPVFAVRPKEATTIGGGKYSVNLGDTLMVLVPSLHRDPAAWGNDAASFRPERFAADNLSSIPPNAWKPFGTGARACIGRPFALQEAKLVLTLMLQRFDIAFADPAYQLVVAETLTLKPDGLRITATPRRLPSPAERLRQRQAVDGTVAQQASASTAAPSVSPNSCSPAAPTPLAGAPAMLIVYGSNTGSCEAFARQLFDQAVQRGFAPALGTMDEYVDRLPDEGMLLVVTASYEGNPPGNAVTFVPWVKNLAPGALDGLSYGVFGCGNRQWARTWQAVPRAVDAALERAGAVRVLATGEADANDDFFGPFDSWSDRLWPTLHEHFELDAPLDAAAASDAGVTVEFVEGGRTAALRLPDLSYGTVMASTQLSAGMPEEGTSVGGHILAKHHVEIELPEATVYRTGDYLSVLAHNAPAQVDRVLRRFGLAGDALVRLGAGSERHGLPSAYPVSCRELLAQYVELAQPATQVQVATLARLTRCPPEKAELTRLASPDTYPSSVLAKRLTVLDLLEEFQSCPVSFGQFLDMLQAMRPRQYSISSSPLVSPRVASLTISVLDEPALSGRGHFRGLSSTYLAALAVGDKVAVSVNKSLSTFHLPVDPATPIIMVCAGSGIAPFRGFLQERAAQRKAGVEVGPSMLFVGTHHPDVDQLYRGELDEWVTSGLVTVYTAYSRVHPRRYVHELLGEHREQLLEAYRAGAICYVCGSEAVARSVRNTLIQLYKDETGVPNEEADEWAAAMESTHRRYLADVFT